MYTMFEIDGMISIPDNGKKHTIFCQFFLQLEGPKLGQHDWKASQFWTLTQHMCTQSLK